MAGRVAGPGAIRPARGGAGPSGVHGRLVEGDLRERQGPPPRRFPERPADAGRGARGGRPPRGAARRRGPAWGRLCRREDGRGRAPRGGPARRQARRGGRALGRAPRRRRPPLGRAARGAQRVHAARGRGPGVAVPPVCLSPAALALRVRRPDGDVGPRRERRAARHAVGHAAAPAPDRRGAAGLRLRRAGSRAAPVRVPGALHRVALAARLVPAGVLPRRRAARPQGVSVDGERVHPVQPAADPQREERPAELRAPLAGGLRGAAADAGGDLDRRAEEARLAALVLPRPAAGPGRVPGRRDPRAEREHDPQRVADQGRLARRVPHGLPALPARARGRRAVRGRVGPVPRRARARARPRTAGAGGAGRGAGDDRRGVVGREDAVRRGDLEPAAELPGAGDRDFIACRSRRSRGGTTS